ncbi:MAG: YbhB/YbcL family Raf kinase inhibitor-like protein [Methanotrichaceae archaeon]|nr:YbhB/YbcL family Raf kinase inhibitor-like protein [Methanotrichaceae archaeon]
MKPLIAVTLLFITILLAAAKGVDDDMQKIEVKLGFDRVPIENTCEGKNISPKMEISGLNATSVVVIVDDPDAPVGIFTHWLIWNIEPISVIPAGISNSPSVSKPIKAVQGMNDFRRVGYMGPCPPPGKPHRYFFRGYGLDKMLDLKPGSSRGDLENAMRGHVLQQGESIAIFSR